MNGLDRYKHTCEEFEALGFQVVQDPGDVTLVIMPTTTSIFNFKSHLQLVRQIVLTNKVTEYEFFLTIPIKDMAN